MRAETGVGRATSGDGRHREDVYYAIERPDGRAGQGELRPVEDLLPSWLGVGSALRLYLQDETSLAILVTKTKNRRVALFQTHPLPR